MISGEINKIRRINISRNENGENNNKKHDHGSMIDVNIIHDT